MPLRSTNALSAPAKAMIDKKMPPSFWLSA